MLSDYPVKRVKLLQQSRLNAPYGARCFLTVRSHVFLVSVRRGLNALYGARCFLTRIAAISGPESLQVLMHLMALGAF